MSRGSLENFIRLFECRVGKVRGWLGFLGKLGSLGGQLALWDELVLFSRGLIVFGWREIRHVYIFS